LTCRQLTTPVSALASTTPVHQRNVSSGNASSATTRLRCSFCPCKQTTRGSALVKTLTRVRWVLGYSRLVLLQLLRCVSLRYGLQRTFGLPDEKIPSTPPLEPDCFEMAWSPAWYSIDLVEGRMPSLRLLTSPSLSPVWAQRVNTHISAQEQERG
jgi:hypothetical protein